MARVIPPVPHLAASFEIIGAVNISGLLIVRTRISGDREGVKGARSARQDARRNNK